MNNKGSHTVLVVEDNEMMRKALLETLKVLNYATLEAGNGIEALELIKQIQGNGHGESTLEISLIMSDLAMPEMDGQELFYALKELDLEIPLIMLTGYTVTTELDELRKDGLAGWLQKPADLEQISDLLDNIIH